MINRHQPSDSPGTSRVETPAILIADADHRLRYLIRLVIERAGWPAREAATGPEAIDGIEQGRPRLVILDLALPPRGGLEVLRELRTRPEASRPATIVIAAELDPWLRQEAYRLGASCFCAKPFRPSHLIRVVRRLLTAHPGLPARLPRVAGARPPGLPPATRADRLILTFPGPRAPRTGAAGRE